MPEPSPSAADSPHLAQLRAREKMLKHKIAHRIPASADKKEEALARAKSHLAQVQAQIRTAEKAAKSPKP